MPQRQNRSDDTEPWPFGFGSGRDGNITINSNTTFSTAIAGCSGALGLKALTLDAASTFADGRLVKILQMRGGSLTPQNWEYNIIVSGGGTTSITLGLPMTRDFVNSGDDQAFMIQLPEYNNVTIDSTKVLSGTAWDGNKNGIIAFLYAGTFTNNGIVDLDGLGFRNSSNTGDSNGGDSGEGDTGAANVVSGTFVGGAVKGNGGGGGRGTLGGDIPASSGAGGGGNKNAGSSGINGNNGGSGAGTGGSISGNDELTALVPGGAGGQGGHRGTYNDNAGDGGGILSIAGPFLTGTGTFRLRGTAADNPANGDAGGGGGGAGGSFLGKHISAIYTNLTIQLTAGTGGNAVGNGGDGGDGSVGRMHVDYASSVTDLPAGANSRQDRSLFGNKGAISLFL